MATNHTQPACPIGRSSRIDTSVVISECCTETDNLWKWFVYVAELWCLWTIQWNALDSWHKGWILGRVLVIMSQAMRHQFYVVSRCTQQVTSKRNRAVITKTCNICTENTLCHNTKHHGWILRCFQGTWIMLHAEQMPCLKHIKTCCYKRPSLTAPWAIMFWLKGYSSVIKYVIWNIYFLINANNGVCVCVRTCVSTCICTDFSFKKVQVKQYSQLDVSLLTNNANRR